MAKKVSATAVKTWIVDNRNTIVGGVVGIAACVIMMVQCGRISDLEQGQSDLKQGQTELKQGQTELQQGQDSVKAEVIVVQDLVDEGNKVDAETNTIVKRIDANVTDVAADVDTVKTIVKNCCGAKKATAVPAKKPATTPATKPAATVVVKKDVVAVTDSADVKVAVVDSSKNNGNIVVRAKELQSAQVVIGNGSVNNGNIIIGDNNVVVVNEPVQQKMDTLTIVKKHTRTVEYVFTGVKKRKYR